MKDSKLFTGFLIIIAGALIFYLYNQYFSSAAIQQKAEIAAQAKADAKLKLDNLYAEIKNIPAEDACTNQRKYEQLITDSRLSGIDEYISISKSKIEKYTPLCEEERKVARAEAERLRALNDIGSWRIGSYVDDFGDATSQKFIANEVSGTFSNSATNDSYLYARVFVDGFPKEEIHFRFSEYDRNSPVTGYMSSGQSYFGKVRDQNGTTYSFSATLYKGSTEVSVNKRNQKELLSLLKTNQQLRFMLRESDGTAVYSFSINTKNYSNAKRKASS